MRRWVDLAAVAVHVVAIGLQSPGAGAQGLTVNAGLDGITAQGQGAVHRFDADRLGQLLAYPGVGPDNMLWRLSRLAQCPVEELVADTSQVNVYLAVRSSEVVSGATTPTVVNTHTCSNSTTETATCSVSHTETVTNSTSSTSSESMDLGFSNTISVRVGASQQLVSVSDAATFTFNKEFGQSYTHTETRALSEGFTASIPVGPGETIQAVMRVDRAAGQWRVAYDAVADGTISGRCNTWPAAWGARSFPLSRLYDGSDPRADPVSFGRRDNRQLAWTETIEYSSGYNARTDFRPVAPQRRGVTRR